jgi:serine/threonine-protein kinase
MDSRPNVLGELDPLIGLTVSGRYRLHALVGQGGMGKVFQAQQIPLGRAVALKVLEANRVDPEFQRRFFGEAAILAKLQSRHTVTIFDYGRDGDLYFIAMELVAGEPLNRVFAAEGAQPVARTLDIALQICRSLREAHAQGIIHRDLKPGNVMLTHGEDGEDLIKVLDFGLAKRLNTSRSDDDTDRDTVPGSPKYMAPEVIRQQAIDGRADIYSLGVMLYHMLAGAVPFDFDNPMDILLAHLHTAPVPLRQVNPRSDVSPELEALVMRCLEKAPEQRFASVSELSQALRAVGQAVGVGFNGAAGPSDPAPSGVRASRSLRVRESDLTPGVPSRRSGGARVVLGAGVLVLAGGIAYGLANHGAPPAPSAAPPQQQVPSAQGAPAEQGMPAEQGAPAATQAEPSAAAPVAPAQPPSEPSQPADPATAPAMVLAPVTIEPKPARARPAAPRDPGPDMVFHGDDVRKDDDEVDDEASPAALPSVLLHVTSQPAGALISMHGQLMGRTPTSFEWHDASARHGEAIALEFKLDGYQTETVMRTIDAEEMSIAARMRPASIASAAAEEQEVDEAEAEPAAEPPEPDPPAP